MQGLCIELNDFIVALAEVQPSAKREGFVTVPNVTWADIGALEDVREELIMAILVGISALSITAHELRSSFKKDLHACLPDYIILKKFRLLFYVYEYFTFVHICVHAHA